MSTNQTQKPNKTPLVVALILCVVIALTVTSIILIKKNQKFQTASELLEAGQMQDAYDIFALLGKFRNADEKAAQIRLTKNDAVMHNCKPGDIIYFGTYEQDNKESNGKEEIEWIVLDVQDSQALVVSKYALDCQKYHGKYGDITWDKCDLRKWLNREFLNTAFCDTEKAMIPTVTVKAEPNPDYETDPGVDTQDKVFLLSIQEAARYFPTDDDRECAGTLYAQEMDAYIQGITRNCWWWLRSPGDDPRDAAYVLSNGEIIPYGYFIGIYNIAVRPALWIELPN